MDAGEKRRWWWSPGVSVTVAVLGVVAAVTVVIMARPAPAQDVLREGSVAYVAQVISPPNAPRAVAGKDHHSFYLEDHAGQVIRSRFSIQNTGTDTVRILSAGMADGAGDMTMTFPAVEMRLGSDTGTAWEPFRAFDLAPGEQASIGLEVTQHEPECEQGRASWSYPVSYMYRGNRIDTFIHSTLTTWIRGDGRPYPCGARV